MDHIRGALLGSIAVCNVVGMLLACAACIDPAYAKGTAVVLGVALLAYLVLLGVMLA